MKKIIVSRIKITPDVGQSSCVGLLGKPPFGHGNYFWFDNGMRCVNMWAENMKHIKDLKNLKQIEVITFSHENSKNIYGLVYDERYSLEYYIPDAKLCFTGCSISKDISDAMECEWSEIYKTITKRMNNKDVVKYIATESKKVNKQPTNICKFESGGYGIAWNTDKYYFDIEIDDNDIAIFLSSDRQKIKFINLGSVISYENEDDLIEALDKIILEITNNIKDPLDLDPSKWAEMCEDVGLEKIDY